MDKMNKAGQPGPSSSFGAVRFNENAAVTVDGIRPMAKKSSKIDQVKDFLAKRTNVTYCRILIIAIVFILLLLIIGLAVGLGSSSDCDESDSRQSDDEYFEDDGAKSKAVVQFQRGKPWTYHRLSRKIIPSHYDVSLAPRFYTDDEQSFDGNVTIKASVNGPTRFVILHILDLKVSSTNIDYVFNATDTEKPKIPRIEDTFFFEPYQYFVIELDSYLKKGTSIEIGISFSGNLSTASQGFYKGHFKHPVTLQKLFVAMTQFEPLDARRAFPCFDEPNMKAFFKMSVTHRSDFKALSNMPPEDGGDPSADSKKDPPVMVTTRFQTTNVPMSTYLVAVTVGQFVSLPPILTKDTKLPVRVYAPEYALDQTRYALQVSVDIIQWMQKYFAFRYPLPKLDFVIYPQFRWTAMENWGLITFREDGLLVTDDTTEVDRDHVVAVIAHEVAHQWFGNLVTMDWWDDLWLNEGFASYMEYPASISAGRLVDSEEYYDYLGAIKADGYPSGRSIRFLKIRSRSDISSAFDSITYQKGSTIIRMLVNAMGVTSFKNGIQEYMRAFQYKNAQTLDLWTTLQREYNDVNVTKVMTSWVEQKGYPILSVELGDGGEELILKQKPFAVPQWYPAGYDNPKSKGALEKWWIPVSVRTKTGELKTEWFPPDRSYYTLRLGPGSRPNETKINANQTAFMRVNYPDAMWLTFGGMLANDITVFSAIDRAGLVDDCLELAKGGYLSYETAFKTIRFLPKETHPLVWDTFVGQAKFIQHMLWDSPQLSTFRAWVGKSIASARTIALRNIQSSVEAGSKNPNYKRILAVLAEASLEFNPSLDANCYVNKYYKTKAWENRDNREIRRAVFAAYAIKNDSEAGINELLKVAAASRLKQVTRQIYYAISRSRNFALLARELGKIYSSEINTNEFLALATYSLNSDRHRAFMWDWARENFDRLKPYFGGPTVKFMRWFVQIAKYFDTKVKYKEFDAFSKSVVRDFGDGKRARRLTVDHMRRNIFWRQNLKGQLEAYLSTLQIPPAEPSTDC